MATVLAYTSPARGHLYPAMAVLTELRDHGHEVHVRTLASEVALCRSEGMDAAAISPAIETLLHTDAGAPTPIEGLRRSVRAFAERAPLEVEDLRAAVDEIRPDVLLVDVNTWGAIAAAEASGLPFAVFCPFPLPLGSPGRPPFGLGLTPLAGPIGRARDALVRPLTLGVLERLSVPRVNAVRREVGVRPVRDVDDLYTLAPLTLAMTAQPFEYPHPGWPDSVQEVGPCVWEPPSDLPAWVAELDGPVVLVTTSSEAQDDGVLVRTALEALRDEPVTVVATMPAGGAGDLEVRPGAHVVPFVPHSAVLPRAVCAVTHGGMGATQKALAAGVPVCAVPFGRDQHEVARRVVVARAGTSLRATRLDPARLRHAIRTAVTRQEGASRVAAAFARAGGGRRAARLVEERLLGLA